MSLVLSETPEQTMSYLRDIIGAQLELNPADIDFEQPLLELGADSIVMNSTLSLIKKKYAVSIRMMQLFEEIPDIQSIADFIHQKLALE